MSSSPRRSVAAEARRASWEALPKPMPYPSELPVSARRQDLLEAIEANQVLVVAGETGSGKTTQLPKMCLELGRGRHGVIAHTQPRRIAARSVAKRQASELGVDLGQAVGYAVRFDERFSPSTLVKVMTDGLLLAEIRQDRLLRAYDTVIVDEAHERSLNVDFLLGHLKWVLSRRADLKVLVTSATIDTGRFAAYFDAPVVEVSGRSWPVEVRYRPDCDDAEEREDPLSLLCDAVSEALESSGGDVLVFVPGERDIRDAADALRQSLGPGLDILPLFARLARADQDKVFRPHGGRRVVVATNVAETSLTVPGITAVVDTGLARVSRYDRRTKISRLPIERISQASADQRAGRCGRLGPGVCLRLYSQQDYSSRPRFADPEIKRSNLASVLLQMASLGLGEPEDFGFLDPPERGALKDARAALVELGALKRQGEATSLTALGRRMAKLPLDPRLARVVLEGSRLGVAHEAIVVACALSVPDPKERPQSGPEAEEAATLHRRFERPESDLLGILALWDHVVGLAETSSGGQFRRRLRHEWLNLSRVREWQDLVGQVRSEMGERSSPRRPCAEVDAGLLHRAALAGFVSHIGRADRRRGDYQGTRGLRFRLSRDSALARRRPSWVAAAELADTGRVWARQAWPVELAWVRSAGAHLIERRASEPWWDPVRAEAMVEVRLVLLGLELGEARPGSLARHDPARARELFVSEGLARRNWERVPPVLRRVEEAEQVLRGWEAKCRASLAAEPSQLEQFYEARVPPEVTSGRDFLRWLGSSGSSASLEVTPADLLAPGAAMPDPHDFPDRWRVGELELEVRYRFEPGAPDDGATVIVPLEVLTRLDAASLDRARFDWGIPGWRHELLAALVRLAPVDRRRLGGVAEVVADLMRTCSAEQGRLLEVVSRRLSGLSGHPVRLSRRHLAALPAHLSLGFEVRLESGDRVATSKDLDALRQRLAPIMQRQLSRRFSGFAKVGVGGFDWDQIPTKLSDGLLEGYPALVDRGERVDLVVLADPDQARRAHWSGVARLLALRVPVSSQQVEASLTRSARLGAQGYPGGLRALVGECLCAACDALLVEQGGPPYERRGFERLEALARAELARSVAALADMAGEVLLSARELERRLERLEGLPGRPGLARVLEDARGQLEGLVPAGFVTLAGPERLGHYPRYLEALSRRLDKLPADLGRDLARLEVLEPVLQAYEKRLRALERGEVSPEEAAALARARWLIEELRVSLWAQSLGTAAPVSEKRVLELLAQPL